MPGIDWIPGVSHVKSLVQAVTGDTEGAARTMENFHKECPIVSQVTSIVQLAAGDAEGALETQKRCLGTVNNVANGIPVIGHAKGLVHHAVGDHEGGNQAFNAATRSTVVVASGAAAGIATGGIGAIPAGIAAGVGYDATASAISGEDQGYIAAFKNAVDNPSAGAFIDAIAIPVGDGLAGYSGGQIANKIHLNNLKALRAAKLEQIDAAATSGEALKLGREANALTAKINTLETGTPHYWNDPKSGKVAAEASTSKVSVPVSGYVDKNKQEEEQIENVIAGIRDYVVLNNDVCQDTAFEREDALYHDSYVEAIEVKENRKQAQKQMYERDEQPPKKNIFDLFSSVEFTTLSDLLKSINKDPNREPNRDPNRKPNNNSRPLLTFPWLRLVMPEEFRYTVVAQLNSCYRGLYHSFIRHMNDWAQVIPSDISAAIERLSPLLTEIDHVVSANDQYDAAEATKKFLEARRGLDFEEYEDLQKALVEIQMSIHRFIQENITFDNYQGRSLNMNGQERLYFRVETEVGTKAMVICLSERLQPITGDVCPIRILVTVYFESWNDFKSHGLLETKKEMEQNRKK
ncbi:uncharacterized protein LOC108628834 [Ceratina calcarata]|uniref:Uncharacterized protein LOC108628834 n=1 Tax=Ceratina calcarata TaxID=156304 RepID=A0AAJ7S7Z6_9HYME|nr:uncharacterized protein LOC108628834 [Ceratina calcarata]XP_026672573.1 uncharacterized protein LOC108628834 [Ceratina calcarata]XP_026672575.1 uncharacterized protein LOC108628834 [Ceratina calcarata]XP_026672576.1 uncharacterized protein LOC108628834 [Ceratina calcarata]